MRTLSRWRDESRRWRTEPGPPPLIAAFSRMKAASRDDRRAVQRLLASGADPNATDASGWTALMYAAQSAHPSVVIALLQAGARAGQRSLAGETAMMAAATGWNHEIDTLRALAAAGGDINSRDSNGATPLILAAHSYWRTDLIQAIVNLGGRLDVRDNLGRSACEFLPLAKMEAQTDQGYATAERLLCSTM